MTEVTPQELLSQLRRMVELLAQSGEMQLDWLEAEGVPVDEMYLQLDDAVPAWYERLDEHGLLTAYTKETLSDLLVSFEPIIGDASHWQDHSLSEVQWDSIRAVAKRALSSFS